MQKVMQLSRTDPRLAKPYQLDMTRDQLTLRSASIRRTVVLVVSLATDRKKLASPDDGQPLGLSLRDDLPGRFFTIETP